MIFLASRKFAESGNESVETLHGMAGLNAYALDSSDNYLNGSA